METYSIEIDYKYIYTTAINIIKDSQTMSSDDLLEKYSEFQKKIKKLYELCITDPDGVPYILAKMLQERENMKTGKESVLNTNVKIGEFVAQKFMYPHVAEPTLEQKREALSKIVSNKETMKYS